MRIVQADGTWVMRYGVSHVQLRRMPDAITVCPVFPKASPEHPGYFPDYGILEGIALLMP